MRNTPSHRRKLNATRVLVRSGSFQAETGSLQCTPCPAGTFSPTKGSTACQPCAAGGFCEEVGASSASVFKLCPPGTWSSTVGLNSSEGCHRCGIGTYQPINGANSSSSCLQCSPGSYAPDAGMAVCERCKAGTYQSAESATACESCPKHSWCATGSSAPTACPPGTVGRGLGLATEDECEPCPAGSWCSAGQAIPCGEGLFNNLTGQDNMGACKRCPEAAVSPEASTGMRNCSCNKDYYDSEPDDDLVSCKPCTAGSSCVPGTTTATLNISVGWYRSTAASVDLRRCPDGSKENSGCIGGIGDKGPCKPCAAHPQTP